MSKTFTSRTNGLSISYDTKTFTECTFKEGVKYLKMFYGTRERFEKEFLNQFKSAQTRQGWDLSDFTKMLDGAFDSATPFTYSEAFSVSDNAFRIRVFNLIDIGDMIAELGHKRICVDGKKHVQKVYSRDGEYLGTEEFDNIYEIHEVNVLPLIQSESEARNTDMSNTIENSVAYALKCWCTSTNKEHWLWIEEQYKDNPLEAVASTFRVHQNLIPHIKEIKRQGDILLVELNEEVEPKGSIVPLTAEQYFGYLTCQS